MHAREGADVVAAADANRTGSEVTPGLQIGTEETGSGQPQAWLREAPDAEPLKQSSGMAFTSTPDTGHWHMGAVPDTMAYYSH